ncbi:MAG: hypothetical protein ABI602_03840 [Candidatus Saccharibacteria bacterium]
MFGHQNDQDYQGQDDQQAISQSVDGVLAVEPAGQDTFNPALPSPGTDFGSPTAIVSPTVTPAADVAEATSAPLTTVASDEPVATLPDSPADTQPLADDALLDIKQQALTELSPLVNHLDQSPEEKFRTTMMMIQASDNQALIKDAYAAAQNISDEKTKAQALLDIVNEINYFTQHVAA